MQEHFAADFPLFRVRHLDGEEEIVAFPGEARRIRLAHKRLHRNNFFVAQNSASQFVVVHDHQKFPARERVGDCKCQRDIPLGVRLQVGEEKRRLLQVLARRDFRPFGVTGRLATLRLHLPACCDRLIFAKALFKDLAIARFLTFHRASHRLTRRNRTIEPAAKSQLPLNHVYSVSRRDDLPRRPGEISR